MKKRLFVFVTGVFLLHSPNFRLLLAASPTRTVITYADFSEKQGITVSDRRKILIQRDRIAE